MQRLVEQLADNGDLLDGLAHVGCVHYHLSIYQHFSGREDEPVPASLVVEGHITPVDLLDMAALHQRRAELGLRLADGRVLTFLLADAKGTIRSTGLGLHAF